MNEIQRLRRGIGALYVLAGVVHWAEMGFVTLISYRLIQVHMTGQLWSRMYFAQFLLLVITGPLYLLLAFRRSGLFTYAALVDYLVGVPVFIILLSIVLALLVRGASPALSFLPGGFLLAYGIGLLSGRAVGFLKPVS